VKVFWEDYVGEDYVGEDYVGEDINPLYECFYEIS
jgi:hypothetical protein